MIWTFDRCALDRVIDGDSMIVDVDTGFYHSAKVHVRLFGVDAPEKNKDPEGWARARSFSDAWLRGTKTLKFLCRGPDKYGRRWLGALHNDLGESLSDALLTQGLATPYRGGKK